MLIVDGHGSHCTIPFYKYCVENKIILYCLPPHTTHHLQPLDVGIFSPLAAAYRKRCREHGRYAHLKVDKLDFLRYYEGAREETFTEATIRSAWAATGLVPWNPVRVIEKIDPKYAKKLRDQLDEQEIAVPSTPARKRRNQYQPTRLHEPPIDFETVPNVTGDPTFAVPLFKRNIDGVKQIVHHLMEGTPNPARHFDEIIVKLDEVQTKSTILQTSFAEMHQATQDRIKKKRSKRTQGKAKVMDGEQYEEEIRQLEEKTRAKEAEKQAQDEKKRAAAERRRQTEEKKRAAALQREERKLERELNAIRKAAEAAAKKVTQEAAKIAKEAAKREKEAAKMAKREAKAAERQLQKDLAAQTPRRCRRAQKKAKTLEPPTPTPPISPHARRLPEQAKMPVRSQRVRRAPPSPGPLPSLAFRARRTLFNSPQTSRTPEPPRTPDPPTSSSSSESGIFSPLSSNPFESHSNFLFVIDPDI
jgi:hypothetical protein